ncbi:MAG: arginase [Elusimicrobia bacterium]|nr:arginase [Elusimicrobiota bacterium]
MLAKKKVVIIGVPMDLGGNRRGVDMGPSAIRATRLSERLAEVGHAVEDYGDVDVPIPEEIKIGDKHKKYIAHIYKVCERLDKWVRKALSDEAIPVVLGGDHSLAVGSIAGSAAHGQKENKNLGLIWFDAHGDMNTPESSGSGNVHGMPFAHVLGMGDHKMAHLGGWKGKVSPHNTCLIGARDLDDREKELIAKSQIKVFTMKEIDRFGISKVMEEAISIAGNGTGGIHVSYDIDVMDPSIAPGVGTPKKGGLSYREAHLAMELLWDSTLVRAMDMVEVNPILDVRNSTAELASELILSVLGKRIF